MTCSDRIQSKVQFYRQITVRLLSALVLFYGDADGSTTIFNPVLILVFRYSVILLSFFSWNYKRLNHALNHFIYEGVVPRPEIEQCILLRHFRANTSYLVAKWSGRDRSASGANHASCSLSNHRFLGIACRHRRLLVSYEDIRPIIPGG